MQPLYPTTEQERHAKARANRTMFDAIAGRYDLLNRLMSLGLDQHWRDRLAALVAAGPGVRCLDLACGTGDVMRALTRRGAMVTGLDASAAMVAVARGRLGEGVRLVQGDALCLPYADGSFDAVTMAFGNRNVASLETLFSEMARVVVPGGRVATLEISQPALPLLRFFFFLYFGHVPALLARLLGADPAAYRYLPDSVLRYPAPEVVAELMHEAGLGNVRVYTAMGGAIAWHVGDKVVSSK